ncbi:hypothetical protein [Massilia sp. IC2-476]|uniref:hypothetical protein n=1 Tax=Massilia sp. IC2-476 TaxID=2887199 RepID=UPI001D0F86E0|nr:hypothetical protein [Massilia sp. IC2-476]MCC2971259.1 hypothetical protein [Massilia sp. IC2-476]
MTLSPPHLVNLAAHVGAGIAAIAIGMALLARAKGTPRHRRWGRVFVAFTLVVCATAVAGNLLFRFIPLFAVLTLLVTYQLLSGWHVLYTRAAGPNRVDVLLWGCALAWALGLLPMLLARSAMPGATSGVVYASLGTLALLLGYDLARWCFPRHWHARLWRIEHIYKMVASLFGMLSSAAGNLFRDGQPWSQLLPSVLGMFVIALLIRRETRPGRLRLRAGTPPASSGSACP